MNNVVIAREHAVLLRGSARFVDDVDRDGQLWMRVVRSPIAHGYLRGIDSTSALHLWGVHSVLTAKDLEHVPFIPIRVVSTPGMDARTQPVIAYDRVRYVGEPVALVIANDPYVAEDAAELVHLDIEPLNPALDTADGRQCLWEPPILNNVICEFHGYVGDVAASFAGAAAVVELEFNVARDSGMPIETRGLIAEWRDDGTLHLWGVTKYIQFTRSTVAGFFGVSKDRVICHRVDVGGMFGVRGEVYPEDFLVPWAAQLTGRPVKWIEDRSEHFVSINHARQHHQRVKMAIAEDGSFLGLVSVGAIDLGAYSRPIGGRLVQIAVETMPGPYRWKAYDLRMRGVATNKTPMGTMRGPTSYETTFVRERLIDIAAGRLGLDPLEVRRRNLIQGQDMPYTMAMGRQMEHPIYDAGDYPALFEELMARIDYTSLLQDIVRRRESGTSVGVGFGVFLDHSGLGMEETVELALRPDGTFVIGTSAAEIGQRLASMVARVLAETLGVGPEVVDVLSGDSRAHDGGSGTFASRTTIFVGNATHDAAKRLKDAALQRASRILNAPAAEIAVSATGFTNGEDSLLWKDLAPIAVIGKHRMDRPTYGFGVVIAVVSVDVATGGVHTERLMIGYDCGRVIDPESTEGQLAGAAIMGIGGALLEELRYDDNGQPQVTTFMDYLMPTCAESPLVEVHMFEANAVPGNPLGVRGVGEAGIVGVGAAIANAVANALQTDGNPVLTQLPVRPDAIRAILTSGYRVSSSRD